MFSSIIKKILKQSLLLLLLQNVLKKVANGVSEISSSHELELATRMEVLAGIITELEKVFTVLTVSIPYVAIIFFSCAHSADFEANRPTLDTVSLLVFVYKKV